MDERKVVATGLFVAGREPTTALEAVKQTLDAVTDPVKLLVEPMLGRPRGMRGDHNPHPASGRRCSNPFRVVSCVADERSAVGVFEQRGRDRRFVSLASRQFDVDRAALCVREGMDLRRESTT